MQLIDSFERGFAYGADSPCLAEVDGDSLSYRQVRELSCQIAHGLHAAGIAHGSKVGLLSANHLLTFAAILGIVRSDGIWLPVNARNSPVENANILARGDCEFLFLHSQFASQIALLRVELPALKGMVCIDRELPGVPSLTQWASQYPAQYFRSEAVADDVVAIRGTGGTTGLPKGVLITHRNYQTLFANWYAAMPVESRPVHLVIAPLSHAAGAMAFATCGYGGANVIMNSTDPADIIDAIERHAVTQLYLPPTMIYKLLAHPGVRRGNYASLRYFVYSAAPISVDKLREALDVFGSVMVQAYGQAEAPFTCTVMTTHDHAAILANPRWQHRLASCGRASPFVRVGIMNAQGTLLSANEQGEIVVQGDLVMRGYFKDPDKTAYALQHGWLHTGDIGYQDADGYVYIVDRLKDLIVSGGFNIAPNEIEQVLWSLPEVSDCAVIGVPDAYWGEAVKAVVELKEGAQWNAEQAIAVCVERLGKMKAPKSIDVWTSLPRSSVGKVLKREIREHFWQGQERRV